MNTTVIRGNIAARTTYLVDVTGIDRRAIGRAAGERDRLLESCLDETKHNSAMGVGLLERVGRVLGVPWHELASPYFRADAYGIPVHLTGGDHPPKK